MTQDIMNEWSLQNVPPKKRKILLIFDNAASNSRKITKQKSSSRILIRNQYVKL